jgi:integrase
MTTDRSAALLLAIGTGCRIGEALQVRSGDVRECGAAGWVVVFDGWHAGIAPKVRNDGSERVIKNSDSVRCTPLHPAIVPAIRAAQARNANAARLFGDIAAAAVLPQSTDAKTQHAAKKGADAAVKKFTGSPMRALQRHLGVTQSAHGFRHSMSDLFDAANIIEKHRESFLGHTTRRYGSKTSASDLRPMVDRLPVLGVA